MREQQENRSVIPGDDRHCSFAMVSTVALEPQRVSYSKDRAPMVKWPGSEAVNS